MKPLTKILWIAGTLLVCMMAYSPTLQGDFISDDNGLILARSQYLNSFDGLKELVSHQYWWEAGDPGARVVLYRPWVEFTFWLDWRLSNGKPLAFHISNVLLHSANILLIILLLEPLVGFASALIVGALAGLTPAHVATVGWISGRTDMWATFFSLLFVFLLSKSIQKNSWKLLIASSASLFLGLAAKELAITAPLIAYLYLYVSRSETESKFKITPTHWAALAVPVVLYAVIRSVVIGGANVHILSSIAANLPSIAEQYVRTASHMIAPFAFSFEYGFVWGDGPFGTLEIVAGWALFLGCFYLVLQGLLKRKVWAFGGAWFIIALLPVYGLGQNYAPLVDLYGYSAAGGLFLFLVAGVRELWMKEFGVSSLKNAAIGAGVVAVMFGALTYSRAPVMNNEVDLMLQTLKHRPHKTDILIATADAYFADEITDSALVYLEKAHVSDTSSIVPHLRAAEYYLGINDIQSAAPHVDAIAALDPNNNEGQLTIAKFYYQGGRFDLALATYEKAFTIQAPSSVALYDYGLVLIGLERFEDAIKIYEYYLEKKPNNSGALTNTGFCLENLGRLDEALRYYERAVDAEPDNITALEALSLNYQKKGDFSRANVAAEKFYSLNPPEHRRERVKAALMKD